MTERTFHKTIIQIVVLSEEKLENPSLDDVNYMIHDGDCSGKVEVVERSELNGADMAKALEDQASDPSFFNLTPEGDDNDTPNDASDDSLIDVPRELGEGDEYSEQDDPDAA